MDSRVFVSQQSYLENVGTEPVSVAQNAKYINGEYAGVLEWNGGLKSNEATLKETNQELVIAPMPVIENAKFDGTMSKPTMLFSISKNTKNPELSAKFLNFILNDPEGIKLMGTSRGIPASKIAVEVLTEDEQIDGVVKEGYEYGLEVPNMQQTPFLTRVLLPSLKPAIVSCVIFQFVWSFNDYLGPLIYITSVEKYPVSMALKMNIDTSSGVVEWNQIMAMSIISLLPAILLYFSSQKYFVEGVTSSGIKG